MDCKECGNKLLCKDLLEEGLIDLSCEDVANIATASLKEEVKDERQ